VAVLVDPASKTTTETTLQEVKSAARAMALQIQVFHASNGREIGAAFATFERERSTRFSSVVGLVYRPDVPGIGSTQLQSQGKQTCSR
jgi:hypothetical protein